MQLFGGYFVLPNRFYLSSDAPAETSLKSHRAPAQNGLVERYGTISIGNLADLELFPDMIARYGGVATNCFGFHQYVYTLKAEPGSTFEPTSAIFYDDQKYMSIVVDPSDRDLWKFTLQDFVAKASEQEKSCLNDLVPAIVD